MKKKRGISRKLFSVITFAFNFVVIFILLRIKDIYNLELWLSICISVPLLVIGNALINKFIAVNE